MARVKYGTSWPDSLTDLDIELQVIKFYNTDKKSPKRLSLYEHYRNAITAAWPEDDHHRWSDQILSKAVEEEIVILIGCSDSSKTYCMSRFALIDWWAFPEDTLWLISSTEFRGAELRIWGCIKQLYNRARIRYPHLPGNVLESAHAITTEGIDDQGELARSLQRGMIVVPMKKGGTSVGLSAYIGTKAPRLRHAGDEVALAPPDFLDAYSNWFGKENFKGLMAFNPLDLTDPGCTAAEPIEGWDAWVDTGKTQEWRAKWFGAWVIALDGRDSPNNDFKTEKPKFPYLISQKKLKAVAATYGEDSWQWYSQCIGKPNKSLALWRVITRAMCDQNHAFDTAQWRDNNQTIIYAVDPAYGGGDRCAGIWIEFGHDLNDREIVRFNEPEIIPVSINPLVKQEPEEQIARFVRNRLDQLGIGPENCFYDSFGRGTLGFYFAQIFGASTPVPVDSGAKPTGRPVRFDLYVEEGYDKRLKRCDEHYSKFVSEMWFSLAEAIKSQQVRELPSSVVRELSARIYRVVAGNRMEVEPKDKYKERVGKSCDLADAACLAIEGARQRGFKITRIGASDPRVATKEDWIAREGKEYEEAIKAQTLEREGFVVDVM